MNYSSCLLVDRLQSREDILGISFGLVASPVK